MAFTSMDQLRDDSEEIPIIGRALTTRQATMPTIIKMLLRQLEEQVDGFPVNQLAHCLQTATRALRDHAAEEIIVAALCHDLGKTISEANHGAISAEIIKAYVSAEAYEIVRTHEEFQGRYIYRFIGKDPEARRKYAGEKWYGLACQFSDAWDQTAFDPNYETLPLEYFEPLIERVFSRPSGAYDMSPTVAAAGESRVVNRVGSREQDPVLGTANQGAPIDKEETRVDCGLLKAFCLAVFTKLGVSGRDAETWAQVLIQTSLRGVDSHGILVLPIYASILEAGGIRPHGCARIVAQDGPLVVIDGDGGIGQVIADQAMEVAIERARDFGLSLVSVRNSNHFGMAAYYALKSLEGGMVGAAFTNAGPALAAWGGRTRVIGSNAMAIAIPAGQEFPVVFDAAIGAAAAARIFLALEKGESIPWDWMLDKDGKATDDPQVLFDGGVMLPFGKHKGYGLGVIVDVLTGVLSGGLFSTGVGRFGADLSHPPGICHAFAALDVKRFLPLGDFKTRVDSMVRTIKASDLLEGFDRVSLPGERGFRTAEERQRHGIPIHAQLKRDLAALAARLGVDSPCSAKKN